MQIFNQTSPNTPNNKSIIRYQSARRGHPFTGLNIRIAVANYRNNSTWVSAKKLAQHLDLFFYVDHENVMKLGTFLLALERLKHHLFEQSGHLRKIIGQSHPNPDYAGTGNVPKGQDLENMVAPQIKTVTQPVPFLDGKDNHFLAEIRRYFESYGRQALKLKSRAAPISSSSRGYGTC